MSSTVWSALDTFCKETVRLDPQRTSTARSSRSWLITQIESFPEAVEGFPALYPKPFDVQFGSFSRRTKIRPLDDIDFIVVLDAQGAMYSSTGNVQEYRLQVPDDASTLVSLSDGNALNSRRVLNMLRDALSVVPQYEKAEIHRQQEAVTLKLKSYEWNFDIVPGFFTKPEADGRQYYLIPNGQGNWKKTDPRIDSARVTDLNQKHNGEMLDTLRMVKYWQRRPTMPSIQSYLLENMVLDYFLGATYTEGVLTRLYEVLTHLATAVFAPCWDPKGIQGDLNNLDWDTKSKVSAQAQSAAQRISTAREYVIQTISDHKSAIQELKAVFGDEFPDYGQ